MKSDVLAILDHAGWPALLIDSGGRIVHANEQASVMFGRVVIGEGPLLSSIWAPNNPTKPDQFIADYTRAPVSDREIVFLVKGGQALKLNALLSLAVVEGQKFVLVQIPPGRRPSGPTLSNPLVETNLAQKQKLECALQLARSVSLDFNNALTIVLGHTSLLLTRVPATDPMRQSLLEMERSAERAAEIASDLAAFSRQEKDNKAHSAGNLNTLVRQVCEMFQTRAGTGVEWQLELEPRLFATHVDEAKMQQALVRVVENAVESLNGGVGVVRLISQNLTIGEGAASEEGRLAPGCYVTIEISDSGCGITSEVQGRIFEPFFTTKEGHRGLGLAWVYGIITNHGGTLAVTSTPAEGTTLQIYLPATQRKLADGVAGEVQGGAETILIVDDEELILSLGETVLTAYGYRVLTATSGPRAIQILEETDGPIDLVVTDMVMPAMSGRELVERLRRISPETKILCASGYVRPSQEEDSLYLQKPYTSQQLLVKVRQALD